MPSRLWRDQMPAVHASAGTTAWQLCSDRRVHAHSNTATPVPLTHGACDLLIAGGLTAEDAENEEDDTLLTLRSERTLASK